MPDKSDSSAAVAVLARRNRYPLAWVGTGFLIVLAVLTAYILVSNLAKNPILFLQSVLDGLKLGFVYALIALGYTMVYGIVKLINFAHGDVFMVGAFTSFYAVSQFNLHKWPQALFPSIPGALAIVVGSLTVILLSMLVCTLLAVTIERVAYKPLRDAPRIAALITAIGVSFFLEFFGALQFVFSPRFIPYKSPFDTTAWYIQSGIHPIVSGQASPDNTISFSNIFLIILVASVLVQIFLQILVRRTKIGIAMRATSFDKPTARLMGINVDRVISFTFAVGAAFAGLGGVLYAIAYASIYTQFGILPGLKAFVAAVLGGIGSLPGAFVGALIMGQAESLTMSYISTPMRDAVAFTILIIVLLVKPTGIFGEPAGGKGVGGSMALGYLFTTIVKMAALIAWIYGLLWGLKHKRIWQKALTVILAFGVVQAAFLMQIGDSAVFSPFDQGLLFQAVTMAMVALGLNLIYGFNGQFSLAQWGFFGIGSYCAADITYRWANGDPSGLFVVGIGVIVAALALVGVGRLLRLRRGIPVLSAFTFYLIAIAVAGLVAVLAGRALAHALVPFFGPAGGPGLLRSAAVQQIVFFLSVLIAGAFAAEVSFLFGLPVLTLGSDYFGIATLGFSIVVQTLMVNSDTILPFPEMKGGQGMIGIPKITSWAAAFIFLLLVIVIVRNFVRSSTGRATMSVREDETAAKAMGVDVAGSKLLAFVVGSFVAGIGGGVYAHYIGFLSPDTFNFIAGFNPLIIVVFGGLGSLTGSIAASFVWIFFLEGFLRVLLAQLGTDAPTWRFVLYPMTLLLLMLMKPQGLLGSIEWGFLKADAVVRRLKGNDATQVMAQKEQV